MAISRVFDLARRSMATYQRALDITSHNIANASNPEYSRQRIDFSTEKPEISSGFVWGSGIKIDSIQRVRNGLIDNQLRSNNQNYTDNNTRSVILGQVEELFSEPSELGLANLMNEFFDSWQQLALTPNSMPLRANVVNSAQQVAKRVESLNDGLDIAQSNLFTELKSNVEILNNYVEQVQRLNAQIYEAEQSGSGSGDLLDERDTILDELSRMANVNISYDKDNIATVSIGGVFAADKSTSVKFELSDINGKMSLKSKTGAKVTLNKGELYAQVDIFSNYIPDYKAKIETVMNAFVEAVNGYHSKGYSLQTPPQTGIDFFEAYREGKLIINQEIVDNPRAIAISADGTDGNGELAVKIGDIASEKLLDGQSLTDYYGSFIGKMGNDILKATRLAESTNLVIKQLETQKSSYSGVSIDEEMTNVLKYQKSYEASAKLIHIADTMLETLLNMV